MSAAELLSPTLESSLFKSAEAHLLVVRYIAGEWCYQLATLPSPTGHGQWLPVPGSFTIILSR